VNGFWVFWLVVGLIFLALAVVAVRSDLRGRRRGRDSHWEADDALRSGSNEFGQPGPGSPYGP
jgi:hypothetical protein